MFGGFVFVLVVAGEPIWLRLRCWTVCGGFVVGVCFTNFAGLFLLF